MSDPDFIAVCACAGYHRCVISLHSVGARFSNLTSVACAGSSQFALALFFAMLASAICSGMMVMPNHVAPMQLPASVVAPGLVELGIQPLNGPLLRLCYFAVGLGDNAARGARQLSRRRAYPGPNTNWRTTFASVQDSAFGHSIVPLYVLL